MARRSRSQILIKKIVECADGEDCEEHASRMVFVGDDGDVRILHGDDTEWVSEDNVRILKAGGHDVILIEDEDGDGEEGSSIKRRIHRVMQRVAEGGRGLHAAHGGGAFLGVQLSDLTAELRTHFGVPDDAGVLVGKVVDGSPAFAPCGGRRHRDRGRRRTDGLRVGPGACDWRPW